MKDYDSFSSLISDLNAGLWAESRLDRFRSQALETMGADRFCLYHFEDPSSFELVLNSGCKNPSKVRLETVLDKIPQDPASALSKPIVFTTLEIADCSPPKWGQFLLSISRAFLQSSGPRSYLFGVFPAHKGMGLVVFSRLMNKLPDFTDEEKGLLGALCPHLSNYLRLRTICLFWRGKNFREWFFKNQGLSKREIEVGLLLFDGLEVDHLAAKLDITEDTARDHIRNIYSKMKVHSRTELFALYIGLCGKMIKESLGEKT